MKPLDRFLMLETARPAEADEAPPIAHRMSERFGAVSAELPPAGAPLDVDAAPAPAAEPARDPFAPPPEAPLKLELENRDASVGRATIRCIDCGLENARYIHDVCGRCGAKLDTRAVCQLNLQLLQDEQAAAFEAKQAADQARAAAAAYALQHPELEPAPEAPPARPILDRLADRVAWGPAARWPLPARRAVVVGIAGSVLGGLYLATDYGPIGFVLALVVVLGLCLVPT